MYDGYICGYQSSASYSHAILCPFCHIVLLRGIILAFCSQLNDSTEWMDKDGQDGYLQVGQHDSS